MQHIADLAGCSRAAVSKALRDAPDISPLRRKQIQNLARKMGYRPNPLISALLASRSTGKAAARGKGTIAVISDWPPGPDGESWRRNPNIMGQMKGLMDRADEMGFLVEEFSLASRCYTASRLHKVLTSRGIRGVLVLPCPNYAEFLKFPVEHYSVAVIGNREQIHAFHHTSTNRFDDMLIVMKNLLRLGYQHPGLAITRGMDEITNMQYHGGYLAHLDVLDKAPRPPIFLFDEVPPKPVKGGGVMPLMKWIKDQQVDVVIGDVALYDSLIENGVKIPKELGFAGINLRPEHKKISGLRNFMRAVGAAAVDLVAGQLYRNETGLPTRPKTVLLKGEWNPGGTVCTRAASSSANLPVRRTSGG